MSEHPTYKSPRHMLLNFFEKSRDNWKFKCIKATQKIKYFTNKVKYLQESREKWKTQAKAWKAQAQQLEQKLATMQASGNYIINSNKDEASPITVTKGDNEPVKYFENTPAHHTYSSDHILLFISLFLTAAISLRGTTNAIDVFFTFFGFTLPVPSWHTGRLWVLRLGYYKLMRSKEIANDWVYIIDHSIQISNIKCLVIIAVRLSNLNNFGPLCYEDVEPIELVPVTQSNGEVIYQQLEAAAKKTGVPREIVADGGSDLNAGINKFCEQHKETCRIYDIKHKAAIILKNALNANPHWNEFTTLATSTKLALQQTSLASLVPPNQKTKARDMNLGSLVQWGYKILIFLKKQEENPDLQYDQAKIKEKLGWVVNFSELLLEWHEILQITDKAISFVRHNGIYQGCDIDLENWLSKDTSNIESALAVTKRLVEFIHDESIKAHPGERLVGSSEVLESIFGTQKRIEQNQSKSGFTSLLLSIAAIVSKTTSEVIYKAMESTPVKKITEWAKKYIGETVQSRRKKELGSAKDEKQKWDYVLDG